MKTTHTMDGSWRWIFRSLCNNILPEYNHCYTWRLVNSNDVLVGRLWVVSTLIILVSCARKNGEQWAESDLISTFQIWSHSRSRGIQKITQIARFLGPTLGLRGADMTPVGPILAPWSLISGKISISNCALKLSDTKSALGSFVVLHFRQLEIAHVVSGIIMISENKA